MADRFGCSLTVFSICRLSLWLLRPSGLTLGINAVVGGALCVRIEPGKMYTVFL